MDVVDENKPSFKNFAYLPPELRMMVVDEMETRSRVRFGRCSKRCNKEAKYSKNYIYGLKLVASSKESLYIEVLHEQKENEEIKFYGYRLEFFREPKLRSRMYLPRRTKQKMSIGMGDVFMKQLDQTGNQIWKQKLDNDSNLVELAIDYFKNLFLPCQRRIKLLDIRGNAFKNHLPKLNHMFKSVRNLNHLVIDNCTISLPMITNIKHAIKSLCWYDKHHTDMLLEQVLEHGVTNFLIMPKLKLSFEEFIKLPAQRLYVHIGQMKEIDLFRLIRSWQNDELGKSMQWYKWVLMGSQFDFQQLVAMLRIGNLRVVENGEPSNKHVVPHLKQENKIATIGVSEQTQVLTFDTNVILHHRL